MEDTNPTELNFSDGSNNSSDSEEESLSFVTLKDDNITMLINGQPGYPVALPKYVSVKKKREDKFRIVVNKIFDGCGMYCVKPVSEENVKNRANEVVNWLFERANVAAAAAAAAAATTSQEEEKQEQQSQPEQQEQPVIELTPELTREITYEEITVILSTSIKKDKAAKLITFCGMLLAQTNRDQINCGFQAESSAGKSYIPLELASYFPPNEIVKIAEASPKAFYHKGVWDETRKASVCDLEHKIVIFLDMPHFQLLEKMRTVLSKDDKELISYIVDKNKSGAIRTKTVIIKGFASFFFCTAKMDPDEQEKTRLVLISPETGQDKLEESLELSALRNSNYEEYRSTIEGDPKRKWLIDRIYSLRQGGTRDIVIPENGKAVLRMFLEGRRGHLLARHQRDLPRIFSFIKAHALLNAFNRDKVVNGKPAAESTTIIATKADIEAGFALYKEIEESNELGLSPYILKIYKEVIEPDLDPINGLSRKDIRSKYYKLFHKALLPKLEESVFTQLESAGLIQQEPDPKDKRKMLVYHPVSGNISPPSSPQKINHEACFWETFDNLQKQKQTKGAEGTVSETILKQDLISSGKFTAGEAAQLIKDMISSERLENPVYDVLYKKTGGGA
jgi:hypothetical protein